MLFRMTDVEQVQALAPALAARLSRLSRALTREVEGPSRTQFSTLARLQDEGPHRIGDLALAERVAQPTMTTLVSRLERAGFVERRDDPADRRAVLVAVTDAGRREVRRLREARTRVLAERLERLSPADRSTLAAALPVLDALIGR
jgi:DNA-binding MarR family transcriptional regulator